MPRLTTAVEATHSLGYGIDEDTALEVRGGELRVLGTGNVTVLDPAGFGTQVLRPGDVRDAARP